MHKSSGRLSPAAVTSGCGSIWPTTGSRQAAVSALREICGSGSMPPRRMNERKPAERFRRAKAASRAAAIMRFVGMITAPSRRERLTIARTLCARSIS